MTMSVATVEKTIREVNRRISEWNEVGLPDWREDQTRYGIIDPIIHALGWDTADPKECHPEYPRSDSGDRVDYAFFLHLDMAKVREDGMLAPDIIIEAKRLGEPLDVHVDKLREYVQTQPRMAGGVAVLTNGVEWRLYPVGERGGLPRKLRDEDLVNIQEWRPKQAAQTLNRQLGRRR